MITNVQFLRAFAALSVVIYHTNFFYRDGVHTEFQGVAMFFVISGFIMTHISRKNSADFFYHRCVRIIPLYFLITLALFVVKLKALLPFGIFHYLAINGGSSVGLTLMTLVKSLLFIPYKNPSGEWQPINAVGWTLNLEMYFYVIYSIALLVSTRFAPVVVGIVVLLVNLLGGICVDNTCAFYAHSYTNYFVLGIVAFYSWQAVKPWLEGGGEAERRRGVGLLGVLLGIVFFLWHLSPEFVALFASPFIATMNYLLPFLAVIIALCLHSVRVQCDWKPLLVLGEASYALYLIHTLVIGQIRSLGYVVDASSGIGMLVIVVTVSTLMAIALHYWVERPVTRYLRSARIG